MRILIFYTAGNHYGYGHRYRCEALAERASELGHDVAAMTIAIDDDNPWVQYAMGDKSPFMGHGQGFRRMLKSCMSAYGPDWVVVDSAYPTDKHFLRVVHQHKAKLAYINASDHPTASADLLWSQTGPKTVLLRQSVLRSMPEPEDHWFVYEGSTKAGLQNRFSLTMLGPAWLIRSKYSNEDAVMLGASSVARMKGDEILEYMRKAKVACVHMGMICWELATLGVPMYVFSTTGKYLEGALRLEGLGLAKAYPEIGIPEPDKLREFLQQPIVVPSVWQRPDGKAANRLLERMQT